MHNSSISNDRKPVKRDFEVLTLVEAMNKYGWEDEDYDPESDPGYIAWKAGEKERQERRDRFADQFDTWLETEAASEQEAQGYSAWVDDPSVLLNLTPENVAIINTLSPDNIGYLMNKINVEAQRRREKDMPKAAKVIDRQVHKVQTAPEGTRNDTLNRAAHTLGGLVGMGYVERVDIEPALLNAALANGLSEKEATATIRSGLDAGIKKPLALDTQRQAEISDVRNDMSYTDTGNANRMLKSVGDSLIYVPSLGEWYLWDGTTYRRTSEGQIIEQAQQTVRQFMADAAIMASENELRAAQRWGLMSLNKGRLEAMVSLVSQAVARQPFELDSDPMLLGTQNAVIDLRTGKPVVPDHSDLITRRISAEYDPSAKAEAFERYVKMAMGGDLDMVDYIQRLVGYTLTGNTNEKLMVLLVGETDTGKTVLVEVLQALMGDYGTTLPSNTFAQFGGGRKGNEASPDLARLFGRRLAASDESDQGMRLNAGLVKQLTGRGKRIARNLYRDYFEYDPTDKIWLATNFMPSIASDDEAMWNRVRIIEFTNRIPKEQQDKGLSQRIITQELSGVLNWALEGVRKYLAYGLSEPEAAKRAWQAKFEEQDTVGRFLKELEYGEGITRQSDLYRAYEAWAAEQGETALGKKRFNDQVKAKIGKNEVPMKAHRTNKQGDVWQGVTIPEHMKRYIPTF